MIQRVLGIVGQVVGLGFRVSACRVRGFVGWSGLRFWVCVYVYGVGVKVQGLSALWVNGRFGGLELWVRGFP